MFGGGQIDGYVKRLIDDDSDSDEERKNRKQSTSGISSKRSATDILTEVNKPGYYCWTFNLDECTFCITFSFKGYTESTLTHRGCPEIISRLGKYFL